MADGSGGTIAQRLEALGITLPAVPQLPPGVEPNRVNLVVHGGIAYVSGVGPIGTHGAVGDELTVEQGYAAARRAALFMLARLDEELGDLDAVAQWLRVTGFIRSAAGFDRQPLVLNGFSDLITELYGERGRSSRSAIGTSALPLGMPVEVEATVALR